VVRFANKLPDGGFFEFGDAVPFRITVTGPEDGANVDCSKAEVNYVLAHDQHGHPLTSTTGCEGVLQTIVDDGHGDDANIFGVGAIENGGWTSYAPINLRNINSMSLRVNSAAGGPSRSARRQRDRAGG